MVRPFYQPKAVIVTLDGSELVLVETSSIDNTFTTTQAIADLASGATSFAYIVPAGTNQATATPIASGTCVAAPGSASPGTGIILPTTGGARLFMNRSGVTVLVYPNDSAVIEAEAANDPVSVVDGGSATFTPTDSVAVATQWYAS